MSPRFDSMPRASADYRLDYRGFGGCRSHCRIRVYRPAGDPVAIVATEMADNEGTSVTNIAELVFRLAWTAAGEPWPAVLDRALP